MAVKSALVTGGCGFIASHLVDKLLNKGYRVTVLDNISTGNRTNLAHQKTNSFLQVIEADIRNFEAIVPYFKNVDMVFHRLADCLRGLGLPTEIPPELDRKAILRTMQVDKKKVGGKVKFALPVRVGEVEVGVEVENVQL